MEIKKKSQLLEEIIRYGKAKAEESGSAFAIEWLMVAACEICIEYRGENPAGADEAYAEEARAVMNIIVENDFSIFKCRNLAADLKKNNPGQGAQILIQLAMANAGKEMDVLTADGMIGWILAHPTERMKNISDEIPEDSAESQAADDIINSADAAADTSGVTANTEGISADSDKGADAGQEDAGTDAGSGDSISSSTTSLQELVRAALAGRDKGAGNKAAESSQSVNGEAAGGSSSVADCSGEDIVEEIKSEDFFPELTAQIRKMRDELSAQIFGQEHAIHTFLAGYFQSRVIARTNKNHKGPGASFLFAGAPGVGKTLLAEKAAELLGMPWKRFDMSEYAERDGVMGFCGTEKVYKDASAGKVTSFVAEHKKCVLLFDEVEKAHPNVIYLFLQILDAGRLKDNYTGEEVSFRDTVIIMTTNAGRILYNGEQKGNLAGISRKTILRALETDISEVTGMPLFPAAICSRFAAGNVIMFNRMDAKNLKQIVHTRLMKNADGLRQEFGFDIEIDDTVESSILFAEGGAADARTVTGRAENFMNTELFELFRLVTAGAGSYTAADIKKLHLTVEIPAEGEIRELFLRKETAEVLFYGKSLPEGECSAGDCSIYAADDRGKADTILKEKEIAAVFIEPTREGKNAYLNMEDVDSPYMEFYQYLREQKPEIPVCILDTGEAVLSAEEKASFHRTGASGIYRTEAGAEELKSVIAGVCAEIHSQKQMDDLARFHKVLRYDSAQRFHEDGTAEICLARLRLDYAVDAEDAGNVMSMISRPNIKFDRVIGAEDAKAELKFFADCLKNPAKFKKTGLKMPKGVLLYGPPGTGKTMLAKALAAEADMTFLAAEGGQFLKKYVGEGPESVHNLFKTARKYAPSILFIDEIDAIGKERGGDRNVGDDVLNALLTEMDGFHVNEAEPVFVLAATNYDVEGHGSRVLDGALVRRFDRKLLVELPNRAERGLYLSMRRADNPAMVISDAKIDNLAARTTGMSLAELDSVIGLALRNALRSEEGLVTDAILEEALETSQGGREKKWDPATLERTARHEAGHAYVCWRCGEKPSYITIVARGNHGGYMQHENAEDKGLYTRKELLGKIRTSLAGRAAEIVYYGDEDGITTGASGDLDSATNMAVHMICTYGMDPGMGLAVLYGGDRNRAMEDPAVRSRVNEILAEELAAAVKEIEEGRDKMDRMVEALMRENHLDGDRIAELFEDNL